MTARFWSVMSAAVLGVACLASGQAGAWTMTEVLSTPASAPIERIEALLVPREEPTDLLFATMNVGADCGGGTPAKLWRATVDPLTHKASSLRLVQELAEIQNVRGALFEDSRGTYFTGSGWCGEKPGYYSTDGAKTFLAATKGVHPPNSTFRYAEFAGRVYAGTGYDPYPGGVYRWLGTTGPDVFEEVLTIPDPRTIVFALTTYSKRLFVGSLVYGSGDCAGTVPVYASGDGTNYAATTGIPDCHSVARFLKVKGTLLAETQAPDGAWFLYRWNGAGWQQQATLPFRFPNYEALVASDGSSLYAFGSPRSGSPAALYRSRNLGLSWTKFAILATGAPEIGAIVPASGGIYALSLGDAQGRGHIYWYPTQ